jgi:hypothetical protein
MEAVKNIMNIIMDFFRDYYGNRGYLTLMLVAVVCLFVLYKEDRKIIWPTFMLIFIIVNPVLYRYVFSKLIYWRLLWMLPEVLIIALAMTRLVVSCKTNAMKAAAIGLLTVVVWFIGTNVHKYGGFYEADNPYKIPQYAVNVFDKILSLDENPKTIMPEPLFLYARQYSGDIEMMYGRDVQGYIVYTNKERLDMFNQISSEDPDFNYIFAIAGGKEIEFIVLDVQKPVASAELQDKYNYHEIGDLEGFRIYRRGDGID